LIPNPILKVLSALSLRRAGYLLMGGQACVFYGAAEFSRDTDVAVLAEPENLERLTLALEDLQADCVEEKQEREADRNYWVPLRAELAQLRRKGRQQ